MTPDPAPLTHLKQALDAFVGILDQEHAALAAGDIEALARLLEVKNRLATDTSGVWSHAADWLRRQATGGIGRDLDIPAGMAPTWREIVELARRAESLNRQNGQMIDAQLLRTRGAIEVLQAAARPVHLYGADGHMLDLPGHGHSIDNV
jgi:flagellar biosynthesis/type III secretory pathway chaperone